MRERHYESVAHIDATPQALFEYLDAHENAARHMRGASWMMAGGRMEISLDDAGGRALGSRIRLDGHVLGLRLHVEEIVTVREAPVRKRWQAIGEVRLLVIGPYDMGFDITPDGPRSWLRMYIDYDLPGRGLWRWVGRALGPMYARWCVNRMVEDAARALLDGERHPGDHRRSPGRNVRH